MRLSDLVGPDLAAQVPEVSLPDEVKSGQVANTRLLEARKCVSVFAFVLSSPFAIDNPIQSLCCYLQKYILYVKLRSKTEHFELRK